MTAIELDLPAPATAIRVQAHVTPERLSALTAVGRHAAALLGQACAAAGAMCLIAPPQDPEA